MTNKTKLAALAVAISTAWAINAHSDKPPSLQVNKQQKLAQELPAILMLVLDENRPLQQLGVVIIKSHEEGEEQ